MRWVKGKALETLKALDGIQVGDQVKVVFTHRQINPETSAAYSKVPFVVDEVTRVDRKEVSHFLKFGQRYYRGSFVRKPRVAYLTATGWGITPDEIVAWRRHP